MTVASALKGYLVAAAATMTEPPCDQVIGGEPDAVNVPTVAYFWAGIGTWEGNTFGQTQELERWHVRLYVPLGPRLPAATTNVEDWIAEFTSAIRAQLFGHMGFGGAATGEGATIGDATPGYVMVGGTLCRIVDMEVSAMLSNVHTIAQ